MKCMSVQWRINIIRKVSGDTLIQTHTGAPCMLGGFPGEVSPRQLAIAMETLKPKKASDPLPFTEITVVKTHTYSSARTLIYHTHWAVSDLWPHQMLLAGQETLLCLLNQSAVLAGLNPTLTHSHTHTRTYIDTHSRCSLICLSGSSQQPFVFLPGLKATLNTLHFVKSYPSWTKVDLLHHIFSDCTTHSAWTKCIKL